MHKKKLGKYKYKIHELVTISQTTKIDTHEEKYFHSNHFISNVACSRHDWAEQLFIRL